MADKQGELFPEDKPKKKPSTSPRAQSARRKRNRQKGQEAEDRANEQRGGERLTPEELWPNYPKMEFNKNALKILQAVPMKAAQAGRLALSIAGFSRLRGL